MADNIDNSVNKVNSLEDFKKRFESLDPEKREMFYKSLDPDFNPNGAEKLDPEMQALRDAVIESSQGKNNNINQTGLFEYLKENRGSSIQSSRNNEYYNNNLSGGLSGGGNGISPASAPQQQPQPQLQPQQQQQQQQQSNSPTAPDNPKKKPGLEDLSPEELASKIEKMQALHTKAQEQSNIYGLHNWRAAKGMNPLATQPADYTLELAKVNQTLIEASVKLGQLEAEKRKREDKDKPKAEIDGKTGSEAETDSPAEKKARKGEKEETQEESKGSTEKGEEASEQNVTTSGKNKDKPFSRAKEEANEPPTASASKEMSTTKEAKTTSSPTATPAPQEKKNTGVEK